MVPNDKVPLIATKDKMWRVPLLLTKMQDLEKLETFLTPMSNSKMSKLPEAMREAKEKSAAKRAEAEAKKAASGKPKPKRSAKAQAKRKRDDDSLDFDAEVVDEHGKTRPALFADDCLNSINYTIEHVDKQHHRQPCVEFAMDAYILFGLCGDLEAAGFERCSTWTKARKAIKTYLNRAHALHPRRSDPDQPQGLLEDHAEEKEHVKEEEDDDGEESERSAYQRMGHVLRGYSMSLASFLGDNFPDLSAVAALDEPFLRTQEFLSCCCQTCFSAISSSF